MKLYRIYKKNMGWRHYRRVLLTENKSRAARFGIEGKLIDFGKGEEVQYTVLLDELLEFIDDVIDELGSRQDIYYCREIVAHGTGADRQLRQYAERNDLRDVVDYIVSETGFGVV